MAWSYAEKGVVYGLIVGIIVMVVLIFLKVFSDSLFCFNPNADNKICLSYNSIFPLLLALIGMVIGMIADKITKKEEEF